MPNIKSIRQSHQDKLIYSSRFQSDRIWQKAGLKCGNQVGAPGRKTQNCPVSTTNITPTSIFRRSPFLLQ